jgi:hypothetical protein
MEFSSQHQNSLMQLSQNQIQHLTFSLAEKHSPEGIFNFFKQLKLSDFLNEIEFEISGDDFEKSFQLATLNYTKDILLKRNIFYQFHFQKRKLKIHGFSLKMADEWFPTKWKLEVSMNGIAWFEIYRHQVNPEFIKRGKVMTFKCQTFVPISFLRLTFLESSHQYGLIHLQAFEIYGEIAVDNNFVQLFSRTKFISLDSLIDFPFSEETHFGLFHRFNDCSLKERNDVFIILYGESKKENFSQKLVEWNEES